MNRPTYKELDNKLTQAKKAVEGGHVNLLNPEVIASDAIELGYSINDEFTESLTAVLRQTTPKQYVGKRPPDLSYQNIIIANALYAFRIASDTFNCQVYLKFTVFDDELWVVSFHKNRNGNKGQKR